MGCGGREAWVRVFPSSLQTPRGFVRCGCVAEVSGACSSWGGEAGACRKDRGGQHGGRGWRGPSGLPC